MENIQINTNSEIDLSLIILNLICAFIISLLIKFHYKKYSTTLTNRDDFSNLFPFITLTVVLVIYIVKSSLALLVATEFPTENTKGEDVAGLVLFQYVELVDIISVTFKLRDAVLPTLL